MNDLFFVASKVFWFVVQPLGLLFFALLAGLVFTWLKWRRIALFVQCMTLVVFFCVCFTNLGALLIQPLENRFQRPTAMPPAVSAIVVLGGATSNRIGSARGVTELNAAGDRMTAALFLARVYPEAPILFSGGVGTLIREGDTEAEAARQFFVEQGIDPDRLLLEDQSRNTAENAAFTANLLPDATVPALLVTSAFHMPRSVGLFRKTEIFFLPWPVDYRSTGIERFGIDVANPLMNLEITGIALREWLGLVAYNWTGRIDDVLPAAAD